MHNVQTKGSKKMCFGGDKLTEIDRIRQRIYISLVLPKNGIPLWVAQRVLLRNSTLIKPLVSLVQGRKEWEKAKDAVTGKGRKKPTN